MAVNAGYNQESAVIPADLDTVWTQIKSMGFKFCKNVSQSTREDGDTGLGQYNIAYTDSTVQTLRITEIAERLPNKRSLGMELMSSDPAVSYSSRMDQIILTSITAAASPSTFIEFSSDFSSDASNEVIQDSKFKKLEFFRDLIELFGGKA
eukprot:TRINITY_DN4958_c0_g1_i1.p1 TRINITY_DN4958_c0_g1~~TRINITY_DN4958_c0_g1_i1.p1  ORF type:complete len:151 (+),score=31.98 TRINITY_DN4958_c0_g1_i1:93-545(+)